MNTAGHIDGTITANLNCVACHSTVTSVDLGLHSGLNGTTDVDNGDCSTCHFGSFPMVEGAVNNTNTYFCARLPHIAGKSQCHKQITDPAHIFTDKKHGENSCVDCHAADRHISPGRSERHGDQFKLCYQICTREHNCDGLR